MCEWTRACVHCARNKSPHHRTLIALQDQDAQPRPVTPPQKTATTLAGWLAGWLRLHVATSEKVAHLAHRKMDCRRLQRLLQVPRDAAVTATFPNQRRRLTCFENTIKRTNRPTNQSTTYETTGRPSFPIIDCNQTPRAAARSLLGVTTFVNSQSLKKANKVV